MDVCLIGVTTHLRLDYNKVNQFNFALCTCGELKSDLHQMRNVLIT